MKNITFFLLFVCGLYNAQAQFIKVGFKSGINLPGKPDININNTTLTQLNTTVKNQKVGYHVGLYSRFGILGMYVRPELYYTHFKTEFTSDNAEDFYIKQSRIDVPVLLGIDFLDIIYSHAGLVGSFYLDEDINIQQVSISKEDHFTIGFQLGAGINLSKLSFELRWEQAFNDKILEFATSDTEYNITSNPTQFLISIGYKL